MCRQPSLCASRRNRRQGLGVHGDTAPEAAWPGSDAAGRGPAGGQPVERSPQIAHGPVSTVLGGDRSAAVPENHPATPGRVGLPAVLASGVVDVTRGCQRGVPRAHRWLDDPGIGLDRISSNRRFERSLNTSPCSATSATPARRAVYEHRSCS
jgi:hypothetical protein